MELKHTCLNCKKRDTNQCPLINDDGETEEVIPVGQEFTCCEIVD